ncbi:MULTISPECIES: hypothetical protein [Niastella]|uniref:DUF3857 domain-containing protein n=1 Tax=Niastella soli TaxID=2821487 RepID=A0ABS3Z2N1_9BACT|nr:hypothetical protein [Niastella soli]MBO9204426.1 hypothetical protein [Niastella soli]
MRISALFAVLMFLTTAGFSQVPYRKYKAGEVYKYRLTTIADRVNFKSKTIAVSEHRVVNEDNILAEEIKWLSLVSMTDKYKARLDSVAHKVNPYRISLLPEGKVLLPKLNIPSMTGPITDLNTFFVAVAPASNAQQLSENNPVINSGVVREGDFTNGLTILYGKDCIVMSQHLIATDKRYTIIRTDFTPPDSFCLKPLVDTIASKTFDKPNNFQMIQKGDDNRLYLYWGVETFSITSKIDKRTGVIVDATMENTLDLRMRVHISPDLKTYADEIPFLIKRSMHLELLK